MPNLLDTFVASRQQREAKQRETDCLRAREVEALEKIAAVLVNSKSEGTPKS